MKGVIITGTQYAYQPRLGTKCHKKECWLTEDFVIAQGVDFKTNTSSETCAQTILVIFLC